MLKDTFERIDVMKIAVFSDIHISLLSDAPSEKFERGVEFLKEKAGNLDAVFICGDVTDYGKKEEIEKLKISFDKVLNGTKLYFAMGNHDLGPHYYKGHEFIKDNMKFYKEILGSYMEKPIIKDEFDKTMSELGNFRWEFNDIGIITVCPLNYLTDKTVHLDDDGIKFLKRSLKEFKDRPCFLLIHSPVLDTVFPYAREFWSCDNIFGIINEYNNVIVLSGHIHHPLQDERSLYLGNFSAISCPSSLYVLVFGGFIETAKTYFFPDAWEFSQGMLIETDEYNIKCSKYDLLKKEEITSPWIFKIGQQDFRKIPSYAPEFTSEMVKIKNGNIEFHTHDFFHHYDIKINDKITKVCSGFYNCPDGKSKPFVSVPLCDFIKESGNYNAEITAFDSYDNKSSKVFLNFTYNI